MSNKTRMVYSFEDFTQALMPKLTVLWSKEHEKKLKRTYGKEYAEHPDVLKMEEKLKNQFCSEIFNHQPQFIRDYIHTYDPQFNPKGRQVLHVLETANYIDQGKSKYICGQLNSQSDGYYLLKYALGQTDVELTKKNNTLQLTLPDKYNAQVRNTVLHENWHLIHADVFKRNVHSAISSPQLLDKLYTTFLIDFIDDYLEPHFIEQNQYALNGFRNALERDDTDVLSLPIYSEIQEYLERCLQGKTENPPDYKKYENIYLDLQLMYDAERAVLLESFNDHPLIHPMQSIPLMMELKQNLPESFADFLNIAHPELTQKDPHSHPFALLLNEIEGNFFSKDKTYRLPVTKTVNSLRDFRSELNHSRNYLLKAPTEFIPSYSTLKKFQEKIDKKNERATRRMVRKASYGKTKNLLEYTLLHFSEEKNFQNTRDSHLLEYIAEFSGRGNLKDPKKFQLCLPFASQLREHLIEAVKKESLERGATRAEALGIRFHTENSQPDLSQLITLSYPPKLESFFAPEEKEKKQGPAL